MGREYHSEASSKENKMNKQQIADLEKVLPVPAHVRDFLEKYIEDFTVLPDDSGNGDIVLHKYPNYRFIVDTGYSLIDVNLVGVIQDENKDFVFVGQNCNYMRVFHNNKLGIKVWTIKETI